MKLLLDHNLSSWLVHRLKNIGVVAHVESLAMSQVDDVTIWNYAKENDFIVVTKDKDFLERSILLGHPPKVIHLRLGNCSVLQSSDLLQGHAGQIKAFAKQNARAYMLLP